MEQGNSIYDYYRKISERYFTALEKQGKARFLWQPMAHPVAIPGYYEFDFFLIRTGKYLLLCEGLSGAVIIDQEKMDTRTERHYNIGQFIKAMPDLLSKKGGRGFVNQVVVNFILDNNQKISPRYRILKNLKL